MMRGLGSSFARGRGISAPGTSGGSPGTCLADRGRLRGEERSAPGKRWGIVVGGSSLCFLCEQPLRGAAERHVVAGNTEGGDENQAVLQCHQSR